MSSSEETQSSESDQEQDKFSIHKGPSEEEENQSSDSSQEDDDETSDEDDKPKLADEDFRQMSFQDLLQLKRRLGSKVYNEAVFGKHNLEKKKEGPQKPKETKGKRKISSAANSSDSDGPPEEVSAKRKVPALGVSGKKARKAEQERGRDPRFDSRQGYFSGRKFREQYGFLNDMRSSELTKLRKQLSRTDDPVETERIKFAMQRTQNQMREFEKQKLLDRKRVEERQNARKAIDEGKRPFYEKQSTKKARQLLEKYTELRETGKLGKHIDKRHRKITAKDRKKLDFET
ncbi:ribosomal RNA processing protein 36 homolog [Uranotaenia lowii]|uniref:ribosomal RNA processing protein 36 homolog n=1 Tax=Uranotaenia lowii TaxID=190385 RepID=UPI002479F872|nr:ribosomal RNA processing protein 36 homolog [Uranotaenia lowii]